MARGRRDGAQRRLRGDVLPGPETLLTVAELALALAGFAGLVAVLLSGSLPGWRAFDRTRISALLEVSFAAAFFALAPICVHALGASEEAAFRVAGAGLATFCAIHYEVMGRRFRRAAKESPNNLGSGALVRVFLLGSYLSVAVAGALAAAGLAPGFGALLLGLIVLLGVGGFTFLRLFIAARDDREAGARSVASAVPLGDGPLGDPARHLPGAALERGLAALAAAPRDAGCLALIVRRLPGGLRETPRAAHLSLEEGVPGDDWSRRPPRKPDAQLTVMQREVAELIANGQPLTLFGDNLFVELDLSAGNLAVGTRIRVGEALVEMTAEPHNGCRKFRQRFGEDALRLVQAKPTRDRNLRGVYWRVVEPGVARIGDPVRVVERR